MSQQESFDHILASLHEATLDDAHWQETSALIDEACRSKGNMLVFGDGGYRDDLEIFFARFCYGGHRYVELEREYFEVYHPLDERVPRLRRLPDSRPVHVAELYTPDEMKTSEVYNEMLPRSDTGNGLHVRLDGPHGSRIIWSVADPLDDDWSSAQVEMFERLLPEIRQFVRMRHALVEAGALRTSLTELLDNTRTGVIQLDRRGRVVAANDRAQELLRAGDILSDRGEALHVTSPTDNTKLQELLSRALPPSGAQGESGSMVVKDPCGTPSRVSMVLHVTPVEDRETDVRTWRTAALVLAVEPKEQGRIDRLVLRETLGLSAAETEVAALVGEGYSVPEMKEAIGRGVHTVRWHIKQSLAKVGVSRQADLARIVRIVGGYLPPEKE